jgi:hypothetical protein
MIERRSGGPSFQAQPAFVDGKFLVAGDLDAIAVACEIHSALKRAVRTMRRDGCQDRIHLCPCNSKERAPDSPCDGPETHRLQISRCSRMSVPRIHIDNYEHKWARSENRDVQRRRSSRIPEKQIDIIVGCRSRCEHFRPISVVVFPRLSALFPRVLGTFLQNAPWHPCC